jgi:adenine deaminase
MIPPSASRTTEPDIRRERRAMIDTLLGPGHADIVLQGGEIVNVLSGEIYAADIALQGEYILRTGDCSELIGPETTVIDVSGKVTMPGLIDAHMHFESAMLNATEFTRLSLASGTTTVVADPHEIANVLGPAGVREMAEECSQLPNRIHLRVPCRTPDVPGVETAGVDIDFNSIPEMLDYPTVDGIGEIQGVAAPKLVYAHTPEVFDDVIASTAYAEAHGKIVDGNAAAIFDNELAAHIIAGGTEISCHETTTKEEAVEKLRNGVFVLMREGSTQRNMAECIRAYTEEGLDSRRLCLCTDDMLPDDLAAKGHMNDVVRRTVAAGIGPAVAVQMATINPATWMGLRNVGTLAPGKLADLLVVDAVETMNPAIVYVAGRQVALDGELVIEIPRYEYPDSVKHSIMRGPVSPEELSIAHDGPTAAVRVIGLIPDQNLSAEIDAELPVVDGIIQASTAEDLLHIAVVERHGHTGEVGRGFVHGFGMQRGAIAETVSHDTHNIIVMGTHVVDMAGAVNAVIALGGGIVLFADGEVVDQLPLEIAGLMTDMLDAREMASASARLTAAAQSQLGVTVHGPFMHLAFLSLATSPTLKITDRGLLDVTSYTIVPAAM